MSGNGFDWALSRLKGGMCVTRTGWNGRGMYIYLVSGSRFLVSRPPLNGLLAEGTEVTYQPHIDMRAADGTFVPWLASQRDLLALDWEAVIVDKQTGEPSNE